MSTIPLDNHQYICGILYNLTKTHFAKFISSHILKIQSIFHSSADLTLSYIHNQFLTSDCPYFGEKEMGVGVIYLQISTKYYLNCDVFQSLLPPFYHEILRDISLAQCLNSYFLLVL